jgi:hypothetical protein
MPRTLLVQRFVIVLGLLASSVGCAHAKTDSVTTGAVNSSRQPGMLHLLRVSKDLSVTVITIKDGVVTSIERGEDPLIRARNKPKIELSHSEELFGGTHVANGAVYTDTTACRPLAISPNGVKAACLRSDGKGTLVLFDLSSPSTTQYNTKITVGEDSTMMLGFLSDGKLAVVADDSSCPFYRRSDRAFSDEPQARVKVIDMRGAVLNSGPCVHGVVVGDKRLAYFTHDPFGNGLYSLNGHTWFRGRPMAFNGAGQLLLIDDSGNLVDRHGRLIAADINDGYWTK